MFANFRCLLKSAAMETAKYPKFVKFDNNIFNFMSCQYHNKYPSSDRRIVEVKATDNLKEENSDPYEPLPLDEMVELKNYEKKMHEIDSRTNYPDIIVTLDIESMINEDIKKEAQMNMNLLKDVEDPITDINEVETESLLNQFLKKDEEIDRKFQKNVGRATSVDIKGLESGALIKQLLETDAQINKDIQRVIEDTIRVLKALKSENDSTNFKQSSQKYNNQKYIGATMALNGLNYEKNQKVINMNMDIQKLIEDTILVLKALKYESEINKDLKRDVQIDMKLKH